MSAEEERVFWDAVDPRSDDDFIRCIFDGPLLHGLDRVAAALDGIPDGPVFDLGCGPGRLTVPAPAFLGRRVCGYDLSERSVTFARELTSIARLWTGPSAPPARFYRCDGRTISELDSSFAGGWSVLLFQHLEPEAVKGYLAEVERVLRPGGRFVFQFAHELDGTTAPYSWNHHPAYVRQWCVDAGLSVREDDDDDELYPTWRWMIAEKP